ncbi:MAG TPA: IS21 family transposase [Actinomycetota bacterium]|nr:IS21 family transposase [Actinomycetota bacterium]
MATPQLPFEGGPGVPRKRLPMRKIEEVLRLRAAGMSTRRIAASIGAGKSTVHEYLARAEAAGVSWPLPEGLDDAALEARLFPEPTPGLASRRPVPDWRQVHRELKGGRHVTLRLLWLEWRGIHPEAWGYSQYCAHYQAWLGGQDVVMRLTYKAGERMFVDFSGDKANWTDPTTGEVHAAEVFVAVLGMSGMLHVEATRSQDLGSWLMAHVHAWEAFGGVAELTVPDNLKSGVTRACYYDPEVNRSYLELARHVGTVVVPTRAAHPRDKAAVEAGVLSVERWVLAPLRHRQFFSLAELNAAIREQTAQLNARAFRGEPASRADLFAELEAPALKALPATRYELAAWKKVTANIDYHVEFDRRCYSVPYRLVRQRLEVRATASTVEVFKANHRVASHVREYGRRRYVTDPDHMPASHRAHLEWTPSRLVSWAGTISADTAAVVEKILATKAHPEQGYRACLGLMGLARRYGNERVDAACRRALACGAVSYTSVKSILAENLDRLALPGTSPTPPPPAHENLRGADYWQEA